MLDPQARAFLDYVAGLNRPPIESMPLALRLAGDALFELTGSRAVLFAFPNLFEFWFIFVVARDRFRPTLTIDTRAAMVALPLLLAAKESQEWFLHVDRFLDSYVATDVVADLWHALTGR